MPWPIPVYGHDRTREFAVWRAEVGQDDIGGRTATMTQVGTVYGKLSQSTGSEVTEQMQPGARHTHSIHLAPTADVERGDELHNAGDVYKVLATHQPSTAIYLRANVEIMEVEEGNQS